MTKFLSALLLSSLISVASHAEISGKPTPEALNEHFTAMTAQGIDLATPYKWELRFAGKVMSQLEAFTQAAHAYGYWPVALESALDGSEYWLYIQKTSVHNEESFAKELFKLLSIANSYGVGKFDGFSISPPDEQAATAEAADQSKE